MAPFFAWRLFEPADFAKMETLLVTPLIPETNQTVKLAPLTTLQRRGDNSPQTTDVLRRTPNRELKGICRLVTMPVNAL